MLESLLSDFTAASRRILGDSLTGVYLHGSAVMGCFNPEKSDLDLLTIIETELSDDVKLAYLNEIVRLNERAPAKGIEMSVVKRCFCKPFVYPTPFELHFSVMHLNWFKTNPQDYVVRMKGEDKDLAAHFTIVNHCGVKLCGAEIADVFGGVPKRDYLDSIWNDVESARKDVLDDPMYVVLTLCRVLGYLRNGLVLSKQTGGEWGLHELPESYHGLLREALDCYRTNRVMQADTDLLGKYTKYVMTQIEAERRKLAE